MLLPLYIRSGSVKYEITLLITVRLGHAQDLFKNVVPDRGIPIINIGLALVLVTDKYVSEVLVEICQTFFKTALILNLPAEFASNN